MPQALIEIPEIDLLAAIRELLKLPEDAEILSWSRDEDWLYEDGLGRSVRVRLRLRVSHPSLPAVERSCHLPVIPASRIMRKPLMEAS